jgi:chromosome segregation ATPase
LNIIIDSLRKQLESNEENINSLKGSNIILKEKLDKSIEEIKKGNNIIDKLTNEINNKKSKLKAIKQTIDTQDQLILQKQKILLTQSKDLDDLKKEIKDKDQKILELKNKNNDYITKLNENEKILEEDKQMILYLNKNLNDIINAPFKSRYQQNQISNKFISSNLFNANVFDENNINLDDKNEINIKDNTLKQPMNNNNYYYNELNLLNEETDEEMIVLPETNLCNYHVSGRLGNTMNKYINTGGFIENGGNSNKNSLLEHKYGDNSSYPENIKSDNGKRTTYNIEEEFPNNLVKSHN